VARDPLTFEMLRTLHHVLAWVLIVVLVIHVLAVVHHDLVRRDGVFRRMWLFAAR
jgi:cytochrome b561